jgi:hypothetical protein
MVAGRRQGAIQRTLQQRARLYLRRHGNPQQRHAVFVRLAGLAGRADGDLGVKAQHDGQIQGRLRMPGGGRSNATRLPQ